MHLPHSRPTRRRYGSVRMCGPLRGHRRRRPSASRKKVPAVVFTHPLDVDVAMVIAPHLRHRMTMAEQIILQPIGYVRGGRREPTDDHGAGVESTIQLDEGYPPDSLTGLDEFSHLDVVYFFHQVNPQRSSTVRDAPR